MDIEPRQADVVGVVKFAGIQLARFKCLHKHIVAQGRSSEVEFHREPLSVKMLGNKEKGPDPKIGATSVSLSQVLAVHRREMAAAELLNATTERVFGDRSNGLGPLRRRELEEKLWRGECVP